MRRSLLRAVAGAILLIGAGEELAAETQGEFDNSCATSLALEKVYKTDCSINTVYNGKTYCFGGEHSKELFLKNPDGVIKRAEAFYASRKQQ
jgi:YHS domain-containing protein